MKIPLLNPALFLLITGSPLMAIAEDQESEIPSIEFLEFLGEWTDSNNEWIDPTLMQQLEENDSNATSDKGEKHETGNL